MATIIRAADAHDRPTPTTLRFDDLAEGLIAEARSEAESIRRRAAEKGRRAAVENVQRRVAPVIEAFEKAADQLKQSQRAWLANWEEEAVRLSAAMAERIVRRQLAREPEIAVSLVREALELAAGSPDVRLRMNPQDHRAFAEDVAGIAKNLSAVGELKVLPDESLQRGECRVETRFGSIDQRFRSQLDRIVEELIG
ncbi:MAG: hypothetical protein JW959_13355 [Pirellulales bacterium]|nr:hypothetical protein [Pirellulales bacterium]